MRNMFYSLIVFAFASSSALAADLPSSGVINFHTGWQLHVETTANNDETAQGSIKAIGYTFSSDGKPWLHEGPASCWGAFDRNGDAYGHCSWSDADGDHIFTQFDGNVAVNKGTNYITGGTGKYAGITGTGPWACSGGKHGESMCNQSLTYSIR